MKIMLFALVVSTVLTSCNGNSNETAKVSEQLVTESNQKSFNKGDIVPSDLVCMVNDEYMGKKQFEVSFEGKTYYGCCQMCKERIPKDQSVRMAIDPLSKKQIDKATALIAITGDRGEVSYFENKATYTNYIKQF
ncbi:hypothetical protein [Sphingobacterium sp. JB170]|uniref:hypothetical protein n=1 Tax=Sphingobacterium sp. JB170 TaxID=1434842 RepID=UPI00097E8709|nr:hypothetical protein [Sphingobacterium sp. JB170]SJN36596.1 MlpB [Sphingobacterium sp. JB170]